MARIVPVVQSFRQAEAAPAPFQQWAQRIIVPRRIDDLAEGHNLLDFLKSAVVIQVEFLHAADVQQQGFPSQQTATAAIPVAKVDELLVGRQLILQGPLGSFSAVVGQLVRLEVQPRQTTDHPVVEGFIGELAAVEVGYFLIVLEGTLMDAQFLLRPLDLQLGDGNLLIRLLNIQFGGAPLQLPVFQSPPVFPGFANNGGSRVCNFSRSFGQNRDRIGTRCKIIAVDFKLFHGQWPCGTCYSSR